MFTVKPDEVYQQSVNGEVKMSCDGIGQPKPTIIWRRVCLFLVIIKSML